MVLKSLRVKWGLRIENKEDYAEVTTTGGGCYRAEVAFLGIGRSPDLSRLNLETVGLQPGLNGGLAVDEFLPDGCARNLCGRRLDR